MCIELSEAKREDLLELSRGLWKSYESPFQGFIRLIAPIIDDDREGSLRHFARRQIEETKAEPDTIWLKAVDSDTGQIVGGAKWVFLRTEYNRGTSSPNERHRLFEATWYPAGVARTFATEAMVHLHYKRIFTQAARQHAYLDLMFVIPAYRHRGIAKQLTEWGLARADEIGLDTWANSNPITRDLFAQYGFECAREMSIDPLAPEDLSETDLVEWEMMRELVQPIPSASLWRPAGGEMGERSSPFAMRTICVFHSIQDDNSQVGNSHFAAEIDEQLKICRRARRLERLFFCKCM